LVVKIRGAIETSATIRPAIQAISGNQDTETMSVRVRISHRIDRPRQDGSPGFEDFVAGDVVEIPEGQFNPALNELLEEPRAEPSSLPTA
jgi:hypothetical protein